MLANIRSTKATSFTYLVHLQNHFCEFLVVLQDFVELRHRVAAEVVGKTGHFRCGRVVSPLAVRTVTADRASRTGSSQARRCVQGPSELWRFAGNPTKGGRKLNSRLQLRLTLTNADSCSKF